MQIADVATKMTPRLDVSDHDPLVDEVIVVTISGLQAGQKVTVTAEVVERKQQVFASCGQFVADRDGHVSLTTAPSVGGTYSGVSGMGLFWSLEPAPGMEKGLRLVKFNASEPLLFTIKVYEGHVTLADVYSSSNIAKLLCTVNIRRWYMAKGVQKIHVREGRLRATLFLPKGQGPFPGVIDMFGRTGSLFEFRAALLASHGFAAMALAYFQFEDLPKRKEDIGFEYFEEAAEFLSNHPSVVPGGIGVLGFSAGGELALHMGHYIPKVKAIITINGLPFMTESPIKYKGRPMGKKYFDISKVGYTEEGSYSKNMWNCPPEEYLPIWETDTHYMVISGEDDMSVDYKQLQMLHDMYPPEKRNLCQLIVYPGAGHNLEPPYAPLSRTSYLLDKKTNTKHFICWGGRPKEHAHAQEDSWKKILSFFTAHLPKQATSGLDSKL